MNRETSLFLTLGLLSAFAPPIFAQDLPSQPGPVPPTSIIGPQLIAWSELQKPQPIPQPAAEPSAAEPSRDNKQADHKPEPATASGRQPQNEAHSATGAQGEKSKN
jgi:hypothetical protein